MTILDIVQDRQYVPVKYGDESGLGTIYRDLDRVFDEFLAPFRGFPVTVAGRDLSAFSPRLNVTEAEKEIKVTAELPGMDEKDIVLTLEDNVLTITGEKKEEREDKDKSYYRVERSYGSFHRSILLPAEIDSDKVKAKFKKGLLTVNLPKLKPEQAKRKTIDIAA